MIKELKKELSALSGVDFFNPKYRNVFKKYFPEETEESVENIEEARLDEVIDEPVVEPTEEVAEAKAEEIVEDKTEEQPAEEVAENVAEEEAVEEVAEEVTEPTNDETPTSEEVAEVVEDTQVEEAEDKIDDHKELIEAKVELELVKAGVREERLEPAKKLLMSEIKKMEDINNVKEWIKQYPEWLQQDKPVAKAIGMTLDNAGDGLTEEEKKLKAMGINPR